MKKDIAVLGSTGSVGTQTLSAARSLGLGVVSLSAAGSNSGLLESQAREFRVRLVCVADKAYRDMKTRLADTSVRVTAGAEGLIQAATIPGAETVVTAVSGAVGLEPTLAAIDAKKRIALANKETLVCAGEIVMDRAREKGAEIIPVDSEHSAVFQCLQGRTAAELKAIVLTASGGPFLGMSRERMRGMTPEQALRHPNWSMGAKISIDSATMMNKGLELIEAMRLFSVPPERVRVLIHPESVIHSMVELSDGAVIAQLGLHDMSLPIRYALTWPNRPAEGISAPNLAELGRLTFFEPDFDAFPCLGLAVDCARRGGSAPCVMSAANEAAVGLFLKQKICFGEIYECVCAALDSIGMIGKPSLTELLEADAAAREYVFGLRP